MKAALFLAAAAAYVVLRVVQFYLRVWRKHRLTINIPGAPTLPFAGNAWELLVPQEKMYSVVLNMGMKYGSIFKVWIGPFLAIAVADPDDLQVVFNSPHLTEKAAIMYDGLVPLIGNGLISMNGPDYKRHRKAMTASLHLDILQDFVAIFNKNSREVMVRLDALAAADEVFDAAPLAGWCGSNVVCQSVLSTATGLEAEMDAVVETINVASKVALFRCLRPWYAVDLLFRLTPEYSQYCFSIKGFADFAGKVLKQKMQEEETPAEPGSKARRQTFLDQFLKSPEAAVLTPSELFDELRTLIFTGAATSMDFQSMFLLCMAMQPDEQRKIQRELDDVFGQEPDRDVLASDLPHLTYMEWTIKEVLRMFPPAPVFSRQATTDVKLPSGYVLPEGTVVTIMPTLVHRNPTYYPNPDKFDPDRFSPENSRTRHPYTFVPFSAGSRSCIGQRYSMMFTKTVMASILRRFDILPDPEGPQRLEDVPLIGGITLSVNGGVRIRVRRRRGTTA